MARKSNFWFATVGTIFIILGLAAAIGISVGLGGSARARTFSVDYTANTFLMDDKPFRYVSGSFHYFRAMENTWQERLRTMRAAGLNAVDTYVEWAFHNPKDGVYTWDGMADLEKFITLAAEEDLYVILRPGPYICAERDNGGLPFWLFRKYPNIQMRTNDANYKTEVSLWYSKLMPKIQKYLYGNGGPIIMVQVENEYGVFHACDKNYLNWLRDETEKYVQGNALLFTTDIPNERIQCGKIEGVFATTDFGLERIDDIETVWKTLRSVQPNGPLVNSEFYPGWLTHWQEENQRRGADEVAAALKTILEYGANVNIYMFFGGTNFGFTAGANDWGFGNYTADITSYDYDAVMTECGDPTVKYIKVRNVISEFITMPDLPVPSNSPTISFSPLTLVPIANVLDDNGKAILGVNSVKSDNPNTFEELDQFSGLVLYETDLPDFEIDPTLLTVEDLHDRALIYVDQMFVGALSRENKIKSLPLSSSFGKKLQILVENQGRINFHLANDTKGILGDVYIQKLTGEQKILNNWTSTSIPLETEQLDKLIAAHKNDRVVIDKSGWLKDGPVVFTGELIVGGTVGGNTYIDTTGWGKGVIFINGFNLGRYWPLVGPQITVFVPKDALKVGINEVILIEYQRIQSDFHIHFVTQPNLDNNK